MNALVYHLGWTTKHRKPSIEVALDPFLESVFRECLTKRSCKLLAFGAHVDHVHLVVSLLPTIAPSDIVRDLKRLATRRLKAHDKNLAEFAWQSSFWALSVEPRDCTKLLSYVRNQRVRHGKGLELNVELERVKLVIETLEEDS